MQQAANRLRQLWTRYRLPLLAGLLGVLLLLWPKSERQEQAGESAAQSELSAQQLEVRLEALLSRVDGAGQVSVMLTLSDNGEVVYQTDASVRDGIQEEQTVLADKAPVVRQTRAPRVLGAAVVCEGADRASVRLAITEAVASLTGLGHDRITVIKMKRQ